MYNEFFDEYKPVAMELFSSAKCNLDCTYCNIPKHNDEVDKLHKDIIEDIKQVDPIIERLKKVYGTNIEHFSHWGTEPSLTLKYFKKFFERAIVEFPKLKNIRLSSNFLSRTQDTIESITEFPVVDGRTFEFNVQLSLDGPSWITDYNRKGGATDKIIKNMVTFVKSINESDTPHKVVVHWKPTVSKEQFQKLIIGDCFLEYYQFFDDVMSQIVDANFNKKVYISYGADPTIVCPDNYTQQDGINFYKLYKIAEEIRANNKFKFVYPDSNYYNAFVKLDTYTSEYFTKQRMFTCSAGDSMFGISNVLNPCHDTFYLANPKIKDTVITVHKNLHKDSRLDNIKTGRHNIARDNLTLSLDEKDPKKLFAYFYRLRAYHDFTTLRLSTGIALIKELAYCGQISKCYKHDEMACLLSMYVNQRHGCLTSNQMNLGSMHFNFIPYYKLFGNGSVEAFVKRLHREKESREI